MTDDGSEAPRRLSRRHALECMVWAGTGVIWTLSGGVPKALSLLDEAQAAEAASSTFTFLQISDSHVGFDKEAEVTAIDTLNEAVGRIKGLSVKPSFLIHTGDITHLSKPDQFDDADQIIGSTGIMTHYVPGEHDVVDAAHGQAYMDRYGKDTWGQGWYPSIRTAYISSGSSMSMNLRPAGLAILGRSNSPGSRKIWRAGQARSPIVVFAHIPLWTIYPRVGLGHR